MAAWLVIGPLSWLTRETQHSQLLTFFFFCSRSQPLPTTLQFKAQLNYNELNHL